MRAVFLDRDGIINKSVIKNGKPYPPDSLETLEWTPDIQKNCQNLVDAGFALFVATNQPDVATKKTPIETVNAIHNKIISFLPIKEIFVCYHTDVDHCECRKPKPGMLLDAAKKWGISLSESIMIGDRWRDIEAGKNAGCRSIFVDYGYDEKLTIPPDKTVTSVTKAIDYILYNYAITQ